MGQSVMRNHQNYCTSIKFINTYSSTIISEATYKKNNYKKYTNEYIYNELK